MTDSRSRFTFLLLVAVAGCSPGSRDDESGGTGSTSGGLDSAADDGTPVWTLAPEPIVTLDASRDPAAPDLYRVVGALRLESGRIVVANAGTHHLLFYSRDRRYLHGAGGRGGGPGEFEALSGIARVRGDSIVAFDNALRRVTVFDGEGRAARSSLLPPGVPNFALVGALTDGSLILRSVFSFGPVGEVVRRPTLFMRYSPEGVVLDTIGVFPGLEIYAVTLGETRALRAMPFGRDVSAAVAGDHVYVGWGDAGGIEVRDRHGRIVRRLAWADEPRPVSDHDRALHREQTLSAIRDPDIRRLRAREFASGHVCYPAVFPPYGRIVADGSGTVWVEDYPEPGGGTRRWTSIDSSGLPVARLVFHGTLVLLDIGPEYALVSTEDETGVESVRMYRIRREL